MVTLNGVDVSVSFSTDGAEVYTETVHVGGSNNPNIIVDSRENDNAMDVYMIVPQSGTFYISYSFRAKKDGLSIPGTSPLSSLFNQQTMVLVEEFLGPYEITRDEGFIFAQALPKPKECNEITCTLVASVQDENGNIITDFTGDVRAWEEINVGQALSTQKVRGGLQDAAANGLTGGIISSFELGGKTNFVYVLMALIAITLMFVYSDKVKYYTAGTIVRLNKKVRKVDHNYKLQDKITRQQKALDKELGRFKRKF